MNHSSTPIPTQLASGAFVTLDDAPTIRITVPERESGVRITVIVLPLLAGVQIPDTGVAADLPRRASAFDLEIPSVDEDERQTVYVVATRRGKDTEVPQLHVDVTDQASITAGGQGHRITIIGQLYRHNGQLRFKAGAQGMIAEWDAFRTTIGCPYDLKGILADTRAEYDPPRQTQVKKKALPAAVRQPAPAKPARSEAPPAGELPPALCRLVYYANKHGSSTRDVYVVSIKQDRIVARSADGRIPKTFLISGIRELYDVATGEDLLPCVHGIARSNTNQLIA